MNWKARSITTLELSEQQLMHVVTSGKPMEHAKAVRLLGMLLRARGDAPEGATPAEPKPKPKPKAEPKPNSVPKDPDLAGFVSSDSGEPWLEVLKASETDDRLALAIETGVVHPIAKA